MPRFEKAKTVDEARQRINKLKEEAVSIQLQLTNKNKIGTDGKRLSTEIFWDWRKKAIYALNCKKSEIMFLKKCIDNPAYNPYEKADVCQLGNGNEVVNKALILLNDAYMMLNVIVTDLGNDITKGEMEKMAEIKKFLVEHEVGV